MEAELAEVNWRVRWDDIMFGAQEKRKLERSGSRLSLARVSYYFACSHRVKKQVDHAALFFHTLTPVV